MDEQRHDPKHARRAALVLAAALAATALTGGAAVSGLSRHVHVGKGTPIVQQAPSRQTPVGWEGDD